MTRHAQSRAAPPSNARVVARARVTGDATDDGQDGSLSEQPSPLAIHQAGPCPPLSDAALRKFCIVQFSAPIFIASEEEGTVNLGIMRLGCINSHVSCAFETLDGDATAGAKYVARSGIFTMEPGCRYKEIQIDLINDVWWRPTVEFKARLSDPQNCELGHYLFTCRVKVMDDDTFPSNRYKLLAETSSEESIATIPKIGILLEYFKLNLSVPGVMWKSILTLLLEQLHNAYFIFTLYINVYFVDVLFSRDPKTAHLLLHDSRHATAVILGVLYCLPLCLLHLWDYQKVRIDLQGVSSAFLKKGIMTKYMNYSESSRMLAKSSDLMMALTQDAHDCAHGYVAVLDTSRLMVKLILLALFILSENPHTLVYLVLLPLIMLAFGLCRHKQLSDADEAVDAQVLGLLRTTEEICTSYTLISEYWQRPQMNEVFRKSADAVQTEGSRASGIRLNNKYFPRWLGTLFISFYIITNASLVLQDKISVGSFLATIRVFQTISSDFAELYMEFLTVTRTIEPVRALTFILNMQTDLKTWKSIGQKRAELTRMILEKESDCVFATHKSGPPIIQHTIPIQLKNVTFKYELHFKKMRQAARLVNPPILQGLSIQVDQGNSVAIIGPPDSGKATLLRLLGHTLFPKADDTGDTGYIFVPRHLRVLHVSQEPTIIRGSPMRNLNFGLSSASELAEEHQRVHKILRRLKMKRTLAILGLPMDTQHCGECQKSAFGVESRESIASTNPNCCSAGPFGNSGCQDSILDRELTFDGQPVAESVSLLSDFDGVSHKGSGVDGCWRRHSEPMSELSRDSEPKGDDSGSDGEPDNENDGTWVDVLTSAEKVKLNLARALVMNPEVLVLQRPLHDGGIADLLLDVIREFVTERGVCMTPETSLHRVSRTCFFTPENLGQALRADVMWEIDSATKGVAEVTKEQVESRQGDLGTSIRGEPDRMGSASSWTSSGQWPQPASPPMRGGTPSVRLASAGLAGSIRPSAGHHRNSSPVPPTFGQVPSGIPQMQTHRVH